MLMPNTSLLLAGRDLHLLDETTPESSPARVRAERRAHHMLTTLARLGGRIAALFL